MDNLDYQGYGWAFAFVLRKGKKTLTITRGMDPKRINIMTEDGEGGDFAPGMLFDAIEKFYNENF